MLTFIPLEDFATSVFSKLEIMVSVRVVATMGSGAWQSPLLGFIAHH